MIQLRKVSSAIMLASVVVLSACASTPMTSNKVVISAKLSGAAEVPPVMSAGSGQLDATFNKETNTLNWTVTYTGLTGPATAGHFHGPAMAGENAGVALGFKGDTASPITGSAVLTPSQMNDLMAGKWYVNLHTAANPKGEIRGQAMVAP